MGLSYIGSRCLLVILVSGKRRLPVPPARTMPFMSLHDKLLTRMDHFAWHAVPREQLNPQLRRRAFHGSNITVAQLELAEGAVVPEHQHHNEQISMVASGSLRFEFPDEHVTVRAGEALR